MLSYKQWKVINESVMGTTAMGIQTTPSLGIVADIPTQDELIAEMKKKLSAAKAKMKKKMDGEVIDPKKAAEPKDADVDADKDAEADSVDAETPKDNEDKEAKETPEEKDSEKDVSSDKEASEEGEEDQDGDDTGKAKEVMMQKKMKANAKECSKCKKMKCDCKKVKKEDVDQDFLSSIQSMMGVPNTKFWDGFTPIENEPSAGEVGFAPQTRIGQ